MVQPEMHSGGEGGLDRILYDRFFATEPAGVFVDVGAARPEFLSMSALYRAHGWRVIAIEPNPAFAAEQRAAGHDVLEYACSDREEDDVEFEVVDLHGDLYEGGPISFESFSSLGIKDSYRQLREHLDVRRIRVNVRRLDALLAEHAPELDRLDLLSIDVEGWELEVLAGLSLERYRPTVLIIENLSTSPLTATRFVRAAIGCGCAWPRTTCMCKGRREYYVIAYASWRSTGPRIARGWTSGEASHSRSQHPAPPSGLPGHLHRSRTSVGTQSDKASEAFTSSAWTCMPLPAQKSRPGAQASTKPHETRPTVTRTACLTGESGGLCTVALPCGWFVDKE
jgi:FkbM family methyltransferase